MDSADILWVTGPFLNLKNLNLKRIKASEIDSALPKGKEQATFLKLAGHLCNV